MVSAASNGKTPAKPGRKRRSIWTGLKSYAESRGAPFLASVVIIAGQAWLADLLSFRPVWLFPTVSAVLLAASAAVYRSDRDEPSAVLRLLAGGFVSVLALASAVILMLLVRDVFGKSSLDPVQLLVAGIALWVVSIAVFALAYWEIDAGGPEERATDRFHLPDLVFPQQQADQEGLAPKDWEPTFADYLYVSVTAATAFSPTDVMPYSKTAKLLMGVESTISFATYGMLVARAVNIAKG